MSTPVVGMRGLVLIILPPIIMPSLPISLSAERMFSNAMIAWSVPGIVVTRSMEPKWLKTSWITPGVLKTLGSCQSQPRTKIY